MTTRVAYPIEVKQEVICMKLDGKTTKEIMSTLTIKNKTQVETWWRWYRNGESHRFLQIVGNHLNRKFSSSSQLKKLVTDITYLPFGKKHLYLSSIMDLYNGEIIAYSIGEKQDIAFVLDTLVQLPKVSNCLLHSDQGSVYTSYAYQNEVKKRGITMSMSRKGTPADNACIESFHASLKSETFYLDELNNEPTSIVIQTVIDYIEYYNSTRIQQKLDYKSPIDYRKSAV